MKVLLNWFPKEAEIKRVRDKLPKGTAVISPKPRDVLSPYEVTYEDDVDIVKDVDIIVARVVPPGIWEKAENMKALVWLHAGCDELDLAMLKRRGILVANNRGANASAVAEHAMALVLAIAKKIVMKHNNVRAAKWTAFWETENQGVLLEGKTMAVLGLGEIGLRVARQAKAFDMRVIGIRRNSEKPAANVDAVYGPKDLHRVLGEADVVVLATPLTKETLGFIDAAALAVMKPTALLVNIARGNLVQEYPLYRALTEGRLAGLATDVWWNYTNAIPATYHFPVPSRTNLQHLPNVIGSGDQAARVREVLDRHIDWATESVAEFIATGRMKRQINLDLGY
ncbi:MAG: phosphoglycerate dehydrogenase [Rhodospirillales bacterium]|nr:phosphoglycerate dehydrogenase [Rhodospirillales bacterium]